MIKKFLIKSLKDQQFDVKENTEFTCKLLLKQINIQSTINFVHTNNNVVSRIKFRLVLLDDTFVNLKVNVRVERDFKNIDTFLDIRALIVSQTAQIILIPSMEVCENELAAGHAATISSIDEIQLYYLHSRGLCKKVSTLNLTKSFLKS